MSPFVCCVCREWKITTLSWHVQPGVTHVDFEEAADQRIGVPKLLPRLAGEALDRQR